MKYLIIKIIAIAICLGACGEVEDADFASLPTPVVIEECDFATQYRSPVPPYDCLERTHFRDYPDLTDGDRETLINPQPRREIEGFEILRWWLAIDIAVVQGNALPWEATLLYGQLPEIIYVKAVDCGGRDPELVESGEINRNSGCANDGFIMVEHNGEKLMVHEFIHLLQYLLFGERGHPSCYFYFDAGSSPDVIGYNDLGLEFICEEGEENFNVPVDKREKEHDC